EGDVPGLLLPEAVDRILERERRAFGQVDLEGEIAALGEMTKLARLLGRKLAAALALPDPIEGVRLVEPEVAAQLSLARQRTRRVVSLSEQPSEHRASPTAELTECGRRPDRPSVRPGRPPRPG